MVLGVFNYVGIYCRALHLGFVGIGWKNSSEANGHSPECAMLANNCSAVHPRVLRFLS